METLAEMGTGFDCASKVSCSHFTSPYQLLTATNWGPNRYPDIPNYSKTHGYFTSKSILFLKPWTMIIFCTHTLFTTAYYWQMAASLLWKRQRPFDISNNISLGWSHYKTPPLWNLCLKLCQVMTWLHNHDNWNFLTLYSQLGNVQVMTWHGLRQRFQSGGVL